MYGKRNGKRTGQEPGRITLREATLGGLGLDRLRDDESDARIRTPSAVTEIGKDSNWFFFF
jgi:hypothetical protein